MSEMLVDNNAADVSDYSAKEACMGRVVKGEAFNLKKSVDYVDGLVVSKILIKKDIGNVTLFLIGDFSYGSAQESIMRIESPNIANELMKSIGGA